MDSRSPITFNDHHPGDSSLHVAVRQGQVEDVRKILIQQQVEVNILNSKHETPLHLACSKNNSPIVVVFGADPFIKDSNNENSYDRNNFDICQLIDKLLFCHDLKLIHACACSTKYNTHNEQYSPGSLSCSGCR